MARRREMLRELAAAFPAPPELQDAMASFYKQPDRVAAIMAAALVEPVLERLLKCSFKNKSSERNRVLFASNGPLSSFAAKIQVAIAIGAVTEPMGDELLRLKNIRNVFAHVATHITLRPKKVLKRLLAFEFLKLRVRYQHRATLPARLPLQARADTS